MKNFLSCRSSNEARRQGSATVELAVCLPVLLLVVLGSIEAAGLTFTRQAMVQTAYEAASVAIRHDATNQTAVNAANQVARGRNLKGVNIRFDPSDVSRVARGQTITVTASVAASEGRSLKSNLIKTNTITAKAVMIKE